MRRVLSCLGPKARGVVPATPPQAFFGACTSELVRVVVPLTVSSVPDRGPGLPGITVQVAGRQGSTLPAFFNSALSDGSAANRGPHIKLGLALKVPPVVPTRTTFCGPVD